MEEASKYSKVPERSVRQDTQFMHFIFEVGFVGRRCVCKLSTPAKATGNRIGSITGEIYQIINISMVI